MEMNGQLHNPGALYLRERSPVSVGGPPANMEDFKSEKSLAHAGRRTPKRPAHSLATALTEPFLYPARSLRGTYRGCCSRKDGARNSS